MGRRIFWNFHKNRDRRDSASSIDPDQTALQQSDQDLDCLPFRLSALSFYKSLNINIKCEYGYLCTFPDF